MQPLTLVFVGANKSQHLNSFVDSHDRCVLIEPLPDCAAILRETFPPPKTTVIEAACGEVSGKFAFNVHNRNGLSSSLGRITQQAVESYADIADLSLIETIDVQVKTLPDILAELGIEHVTTLFIDAQGMDLAILKTMHQWFREGRIDFLQAECDGEGFRHYDGLPDNSEAAHGSFMSQFDYTGSRGAAILNFNPDLRWTRNGSKIKHIINDVVGDESVKLNLGAGATTIAGYQNIDIKDGRSAYPLDVPDGSCDEIRASHVLEHLGRVDSINAVQQWVEKLKPGGRLKIAVPDAKRILESGVVNGKYDVMQEAYLFGSQADNDDFHKSLWTRQKLRAAMLNSGLSDIQDWESEINDCANLPVSLNLEGVKSTETGSTDSIDVKLKALMSVPRYGQMASRCIIDRALGKFGIPLYSTQGVFWGQCMQRAMQVAIDEGVDWILTIDFDSLFSWQHLNMMFERFGQSPEIDALAASQPRRGNHEGLLTCDDMIEVDGRKAVEIMPGQPKRCKTAHFGLTLLRTECFRDLPKPWFWSTPTSKGDWTVNTEKVDDDIYFWKNWEKAGKTLFVDHDVRIGHVEEWAFWYDEKLELCDGEVEKWREQFVGE